MLVAAYMESGRFRGVCRPRRKQVLSGRCFAWVQTYDEKPKRRLFELLQSQGMQPNQQVDFLSDGGEDVRNVQLYLNPQAEHLLDWFHLTMRLTVGCGNKRVS